MPEVWTVLLVQQQVETLTKERDKARDMVEPKLRSVVSVIKHPRRSTKEPRR